jgi:uncharacterized membrane protein HdeD (DUF308 family)
MNRAYEVGGLRQVGSELEALHESWLFVTGLGVALILVGLLAIGSSFFATLATMVVFGVLLLVGGIVQAFTAFWGRRWPGFGAQVLAGVLYLVVGVFLIERPLEAAAGLTLLVAAGLLVGGILKTILALTERFDGWGWALLNGTVSVGLGVAIWRQWPLSGLWVIGLFVGIEMLFSGLSWVMLGLAVRSLPRTVLSP